MTLRSKEVLEQIPIKRDTVGMNDEMGNERLKNQLEKERAEILALQARIQNFTRLNGRRGARRDDDGFNASDAIRRAAFDLSG
jgi:hypothetical protein